MTALIGVPWPSVSVVIVTRAGDASLRRAIRSVTSQRYPGRIECVVVFDQSPAFDLSDVAPADGGDRTLRVIENRRTPGLAGARNAGADRAFGDVLSFCGADDEWLPGKVSHQIAALESSSADVAVTGIELVSRDRRPCDRVPPEDRVTSAVLLRSRVSEIHPSTVAVRREAFHTRIGPFDEAIPGGYGEEYDWLLRAAVAVDLVAVREPLVRVLRGDPFLAARWRTIEEVICEPRVNHPEPVVDRRNAAPLYDRLAARVLGPQRSERRRDRGTRRAVRRVPWRSASRSAT